MDSILYGALFGAIGGAAGTLLGVLIGKVIKSKHVMTVCVAVGVVASVGVGKAIRGKEDPATQRIPAAEIPEAVDTAMAETRKHRIYDVLFSADPEAEAEARAEFAKLFENQPVDQFTAGGQRIGRQLQAKYFNKHLRFASDDQTHRLIVHSRDVLEDLEQRPENCVSYFLGTPDLPVDDYFIALGVRESELKADVLESALTRPSPPPDPVDEDKVIDMLVASYEASGLDLSKGALLDDLKSHDPAEACQAATDHMTALAAMNEKDAAYLFKSLMVLE